MTKLLALFCFMIAIVGCGRDALPYVAGAPDMLVASAPDLGHLPDLLPNCSGNFGVCAVNGYLEILPNGHFTCSTNPNGSMSKAVPEVCDDGFDNNCDGLIDEGCPSTQPLSNFPPLTLTVGSRSLSDDPVFSWGVREGDGKITHGYIFCFIGTNYAAQEKLPVASSGMTMVVLPDHRTGTSYRCQAHGSGEHTWSDIIQVSYP
ncbi:MAG: hypothetical protein Q7K39_00070 [Candidatus Magasanikbacteria bacterium]|nr:hypothetical protein [Candidatus Magasanikbacteria bacterium]